MSDLALLIPATVTASDLLSGSIADLALGPDGDLVLDDTLQTAVVISLFSDRRARDGDALPAGETDRRGWWGDAVADVPGDQIGSHLWLLAREKRTELTRQRAEAYARDALAWLLDDGLARAVEVTATWSAGAPVALRLAVVVRLPDGSARRFDFGLETA